MLYNNSSIIVKKHQPWQYSYSEYYEYLLWVFPRILYIGKFNIYINKLFNNFHKI